jgi:hypothetical protein
MTLSEYLQQRKIKIKLDIKQDGEIKADNYHNVGLLKEIEGVMKVIDKNSEGSEGSESSESSESC